MIFCIPVDKRQQRTTVNSGDRAAVSPRTLYHFIDSRWATCYKQISWLLLCGPVAQLGARMTGSHEVEGSNPSRSTKPTRR